MGIDLATLELIGLMLGSGTATGGITIAGIRVHIQYLREQDRRHQAEIEAAGMRLAALERDHVQLHGMAERAHARIDDLKGAL